MLKSTVSSLRLKLYHPDFPSLNTLICQVFSEKVAIKTKSNTPEIIHGSIRPTTFCVLSVDFKINIQ